MDNTDLPGDESDIDKYLNLEEVDKHTVSDSPSKSKTLGTHGSPLQTALNSAGSTGTETEGPLSDLDEALEAFTVLHGITVPPLSSGGPDAKPKGEDASVEEFLKYLRRLVKTFKYYCFIQNSVEGADTREHPTKEVRKFEVKLHNLHRTFQDMLKSSAVRQKPDEHTLQTLRDSLDELVSFIIVAMNSHPLLLETYGYGSERLKEAYKQKRVEFDRNIEALISCALQTVQFMFFLVSKLSMGRAC